MSERTTYVAPQADTEQPPAKGKRKNQQK